SGFVSRKRDPPSVGRDTWHRLDCLGRVGDDVRSRVATDAPVIDVRSGRIELIDDVTGIGRYHRLPHVDLFATDQLSRVGAQISRAPPDRRARAAIGAIENSFAVRTPLGPIIGGALVRQPRESLRAELEKPDVTTARFPDS